MSDQQRYRGRFQIPTIIHHVICQHQMGIEVWPAEAEVYFRDERFIDPVNTQVRFDAIVYNAPSSDVIWEVRDIHGDPGAGSIDATGLYTAPPKGGLPSGLSDIIVVSATDDPLRRAYARVTLIGFGPIAAPDPKLSIFPKQVYLYYPDYRFDSGRGVHYWNQYIDVSNKMQVFHTTIRHSDSTEVEWFVDSGAGYGPRVGQYEPWYLYKVTGPGDDGFEVKIKARLRDSPSAEDEAKVVQINYTWPGIL